MMKPDEFEKRLSSQPMKRVPGEWRAEILAVAREAPAGRQQTVAADPNRSWLSTINSQLSTLLWPHPKAWAGLAAVWVCILALNFSAQEKPAVLTQASPPPSPELVADLKQQHRMLVELIGATEVREADRPRIFLPRPRSERGEVLAV
jgi:hypothetical protein